MKNSQKNKERLDNREGRALPFFIEFVKFSAAFAVIVMTALLALHVASAAMP